MFNWDFQTAYKDIRKILHFPNNLTDYFKFMMLNNVKRLEKPK